MNKLIFISCASAIKIAPDVFGPNGENYKNMSADQDMAKIKIDILTEGSGEKCIDGQWAKIAYQGYLTNGIQIMDSDSVNGSDLIFSVGTDQTFKCLDMAITQLKAGSKAHIECPTNLVYGGASVQAPLGGAWIPKYSDMDFDVEVKFCNHAPNTNNIYWGKDLAE